jgi:D-lactate dehydrogenase (cytochrome)
MKAINDGELVEAPYPVEDSLFFKIQGDAESIRLASQTIQKIVQAHGSSRFEFAATEQAAEEMWQNRKYALISSIAAAPGHKYLITDVWYARPAILDH